jgi:hypothetical protein
MRPESLHIPKADDDKSSDIEDKPETKEHETQKDDKKSHLSIKDILKETTVQNKSVPTTKSTASESNS